jgi:hypothetical protein
MGAAIIKSSWGYNPSGEHVRLFPGILRKLFSASGDIENFNIYASNPSVELRQFKIDSESALEEVLSIATARILPEPSLHHASFIGYWRWPWLSDVWIQFRFERPHFALVAEDSLREFLADRNPAAKLNVDRLVQLGLDLTSFDSIKELTGHLRDNMTFFIGEAELLYRPSLLDRFHKGYGFEDAIEPFWQMYSIVKQNFPRDEIFNVVKTNSVEFRELEGGKILSRFCRALDQIDYDAKTIFSYVRKLVDRQLSARGIEKSW